MRLNQYYLPETTMLITRFFTLEGVGEITDFMPIESSKTHEASPPYTRRSRREWPLTFELICRPAFNYARDIHTVGLSERGAVFEHADLRLGLFASAPLRKMAAEA